MHSVSLIPATAFQTPGTGARTSDVHTVCICVARSQVEYVECVAFRLRSQLHSNAATDGHGLDGGKRKRSWRPVVTRSDRPGSCARRSRSSSEITLCKQAHHHAKCFPPPKCRPPPTSGDWDRSGGEATCGWVLQSDVSIGGEHSNENYLSGIRSGVDNS